MCMSMLQRSVSPICSLQAWMSQGQRSSVFVWASLFQCSIVERGLIPQASDCMALPHKVRCSVYYLLNRKKNKSCTVTMLVTSRYTNICQYSRITHPCTFFLTFIIFTVFKRSHILFIMCKNCTSYVLALGVNRWWAKHMYLYVDLFAPLFDSPKRHDPTGIRLHDCFGLVT